jgi:hypothetical protein
MSSNASLRDLVLRAQAGDAYAMNDAIAATMNDMRQYAERFARRRGVDVADLESHMAMATKRCIEQYDGTRPFENFVRNAWAREAKNVLVDMLAKKERLPLADGGEEAMKNERVDRDVAVEAVVSQTVEAMIAKLNDTTVKYGKVEFPLGRVAQFLADGVPYDQIPLLCVVAEGVPYDAIASACGIVGSRDMRVSWTRRAIDEIRRRLADEGDTVRIDAPKTPYHGQAAKVVGHASARTPFSHVVEFSDGRRRAVKANEIDVNVEEA